MTILPEDGHPLHASIMGKLAEIAAASSTPPPWVTFWEKLGPKSTDHERLAFYRTVRDAGSLPDDAGFYLIASRPSPRSWSPSMIQENEDRNPRW